MTDHFIYNRERDMKQFKRGMIVPIYRHDSYEGKIWYYKKSESKVMGEIDGYLMVRNKGCVPFVVSVKDVEKYIKRPPLTKEQS